MAKDNNIQDFLTDVADAIREKKGTTDKINPQDFSSEIASIQSGGRDWSEIGYNAEPSFIEEGFAYAKEIKDNWNSNIVTISRKWHSDNRLFIFPNVDLSNVVNATLAFYNCCFLKYVPPISMPKCTNISSMFRTCTALLEIKFVSDTSSITSASDAFSGCKVLTKVDGLDTQNVTNMTNIFTSTALQEVELNCKSATNLTDAVSENSNLKFANFFNTSNVSIFSRLFIRDTNLLKVSTLDFSAITTMENMFFSNNNLRHLDIINLGKSSLTSYDFSRATNWGVANDEIPDARQSLIDSLITYSYDRASNGMPAATIKLSANTKALLTEEEIAQITNKGFTIA